MKRLGFVLVVSMLTLMACGSNKSQEQASAPLLINVENGSTITICGAHADLLKESVEKWGAAIDRSYNIVLTCDVKTPTIKSYASTDSAAILLCKSYNATNRMFTEYASSLTIYDCNKLPGRVPYSILHETGHLFGLCDQYFKTTLPNCSQQAPMGSYSVMASYLTLNLTPDDIMGIRVLQALNPLKDAGSVFIPEEGYYESLEQSKTFYVEAHVMENRTRSVTLTWVGGSSDFVCSKMNLCISPSKGRMALEGETALTYTDETGATFKLNLIK